MGAADAFRLVLALYQRKEWRSLSQPGCCSVWEGARSSVLMAIFNLLMLWLFSDAFKSRLSFLVVCGEVNVKLRRLQNSRQWYRHSAIYMSSPCPRQRLPLTPIRISKISVSDSLQITAAACNHSIHRQEVVPLFFFRLTVKCCQSYVRVTFHDTTSGDDPIN